MTKDPDTKDDTTKSDECPSTKKGSTGRKLQLKTSTRPPAPDPPDPCTTFIT